jgi:hypothetical protein
MALALNDITQVTIRSKLFDQRILNVLHYVVNVAATGSTEDQLFDLADCVALNKGGSTFMTSFLAAVCPELTVESVRAQRVYPTRTIYMEQSLGSQGLNAGVCSTANVAASIAKRSSTPGRMGVGRIQIAGIPATAMIAGGLDVAYMVGKLDPIGTSIKLNITTPFAPVTHVPVIYNPKGNPNKFSLLVSCDTVDRVSTMHRRTLRIGE